MQGNQEEASFVILNNEWENFARMVESELHKEASRNLSLSMGIFFRHPSRIIFD